MTRIFHAVAATFAALFAGLLWVPAQAVQSRYNFAPPASKLAEEIHWLHNYVFVWCLLIAFFVFAWMLIAIVKYRKSNGHKAAQFHESTTVEIIWTIVPFLIVVALAVPATKAVVAMKDTTGAELTVKATGYQWKWGYEYLKGEGEGIAFLSNLATPREQIEGDAQKEARLNNKTYLLEVDQPLVVPVGTKVRVITTANDVIHSWYVPAFAVKQDAFPGFVRDVWFRAEKTGTFRGQCAELCGKEHAFMPIVVEVKSKEDYAQWVVAKKKELGISDKPVVAGPAGPKPVSPEDLNKTWALADLKAQGEKIFNGNCAACHQASGKGVPGQFPALDGSKVLLSSAHDESINILLNGRNQKMPAWKSQLNDVEIASVITYTKNAWGNSTGQVVQPKEVASLRGAQ
ncbi:MAG TPA: cytochrome c oxidase subunit II [Burkholderiaceae bacterium]|nr:cytochrome c oxidase subunit II [Burkholderiaceae bacterium]